MTSHVGAITAAAILFLAIVIQTSIFGRLTIGGIAPDVVVLAIALLALRTRPEVLLLASFLAGLVLDALGADPLGLRALILTVIAFLAVRTTDRADYSPLAVAVWAGVITLVAVVLLIVVGSLVGQLSMEFGEIVRRVVLVPILNLALALAGWPIVTRLLEPARRLV